MGSHRESAHASGYVPSQAVCSPEVCARGVCNKPAGLVTEVRTRSAKKHIVCHDSVTDPSKKYCHAAHVRFQEASATSCENNNSRL